MKSIPKEELLDLSHRLSFHHCFFRELFDVGDVVFSDEVPTAAVIFDGRTDKPYRVVICESFWRGLSNMEQEFVACHELLHIIFDHKKRFREFLKQSDDVISWNIGADVSINEMLVGQFGFRRASLKAPLLKDICFIDNVFENKEPPRMSSDYYVDKLRKEAEKNPRKYYVLLDDHSSMNDTSEEQDCSGVLQEVSEKGLKDFFKALSEGQQKSIMAGNQDVNNWKDVPGDVAKKKKWETVIRHYTKKAIKEDMNPEERWDFPSARYSEVVRTMGALLPFERNIIAEKKHKQKIDILFFLDTSGSCVHLGERFFKAAKSIPTERFNISLACFDTSVTPIDIKDGKIKMGGGTFFHILEEYVQRLDKHPDVVFCLTDGYADQLNASKPERWHFFLTEQSATNCIPPRSKIHELKNFE